MFSKIFNWFETRIDPYPDDVPQTPEGKNVVSFIWSNLNGLHGWLLGLTILSAGLGILSAVLFQYMGQLVDWLGKYTPAQLWAEKGGMLTLMAVVMLLSIVWAFVASNVRLQTLQGVFPMRLRWNFHRLMLGQSLGFYQDEFAGRVSAKVMQTALAVRDTVMTCTDMLVYVAVYLITSGVILVALDGWLLLPFVLWLVLFVGMMRAMIPRLAKTAQRQADARSLMTGRITDAYSNITTVKLFPTARAKPLMPKPRCANLCKPCMRRCAWPRGSIRPAMCSTCRSPWAPPRWACGCGAKARWAWAQWPPPPPWLCGSTACRNGLCGNRRACLKTSAPCKTA